MKKFAFMSFAVALITLVAKTAQAEIVLYASQDIPVGIVKVWNDGDTLYVQYIIDEPWLMTESHLHIATDLAEIPTNKKGNPKPGQFAEGDTYDPPVDEDTFEFDLDDMDLYGEQLYIAAHAVVVSPVEGCWETVWQIGDVETNSDDNYCDEFNYAGFYTSGPWDSGPFANPFIVGTTPTNQFPWISLVVPPYGPYATDFNVSWLGELLFGGKLTVSWSPGRSGTESKMITIIDDCASNTFNESPGFDPDGWRGYPLVESIVELDPVVYGSHAIRFQQLSGDGAIWDWIRLEEPCLREESAWADGTRFVNKGNWATYFTYNTPCLAQDGSLSVTGTGWIYDSEGCPCNYKYDLAETGSPIALQGLIDVTGAALANTGDWSKYYAKFSLWDNSGHVVEVVFGNDWLGTWYEIPPGPWDRIRMENNMGLAQPQQYYTTVGGTLGYDMVGNWVGAGSGATVYPSDGTYLIQLTADPSAKTFTLEVCGKGSSAPVTDPPVTAKLGWPKQNMFDEAKWLEIGTINVGSTFDFSEVNLCVILWASTQAGASETSTVSWSSLGFGSPM